MSTKTKSKEYSNAVLNGKKKTGSILSKLANSTVSNKQRESMKKAGYSDEDVNKLAKNTTIASLVAGPGAGAAVGLITNASIKKRKTK